MKSNLFASTKY